VRSYFQTKYFSIINDRTTGSVAWVLDKAFTPQGFDRLINRPLAQSLGWTPAPELVPT
jgi:hypothetical protein